MTSTHHVRKNIFYWLSLFCLFNLIIFWIAGSFYFTPSYTSALIKEMSLLTYSGQWFILFFIGITFLTHFTLLTCALWFFLSLFIAVLPFPRFIISIAIFLFSFLLILLLSDALVIYRLYQFHISYDIFILILHGLYNNILAFSTTEYALITIMLCFILSLEIICGYAIWKKIANRNDKIRQKRYGKYYKLFLMSIALLLYLSYMMLIYASPNKLILKEITDATRYLPFYHTILNKIGFLDNRIIMLKVNDQYYVKPLATTELPITYLNTKSLQPLTTQPMNLVIIVIDAWRYDMLNQIATPFTKEFSKHSFNFRQHYSGGNATAPGIFSLFFSLPAPYWAAFEKQKIDPILISALQKNHYQIGIFSSSTLQLPDFKTTLFRSIKDLPDMVGKTPYERDQYSTKSFKHFIENAKQHSQPFFSFIFYDAAHSYCGFNEDLKPLTPCIKECNRLLVTQHDDLKPYFNRYQNALMLVDNEIGQVITSLKDNHLLDHTIVIITGDHGEEFNDNQLGYFGHASNYTRYQIQTPLIIHWPHLQPEEISYRTSHFDIIPTIMTKLFSYDEPIKDYSVGFNLFDNEVRPYLIVSSYTDYAIVTSQQSVIITQNGQFKIVNGRGQPLPEHKINLELMQSAFLDLRRFYRSAQ